MKASAENVIYIKNAFSSMANKEDFLSLLNYVKQIVYDEKDFPFQLRQINYYSNSALKVKRYKEFVIKKKSGGARLIHAPVPGLKSIQRCLNLIFQVVYEVNNSAHGFVPGRSIIGNAQKHIGSNYVYNIDLKDFFPSIDQARIWGRLKSRPFNLQGNRQVIGNMVSALCCAELDVERLSAESNWIKIKKNVLPQGAPTSPVLSNIICGQLDNNLQALAKRFNLQYSRYADDITFSSMHNVYQGEGGFIAELEETILAQNFHIKKSKTRLQKQGYRQEVTGLVVNKIVNTNKKYVKELRMWLYYIKSYGLERATQIFDMARLNGTIGHVNATSSFERYILGKLEFLKAVRGNSNPAYALLSQEWQNHKQNQTVKILDQSKVTITIELAEAHGSPNLIELIQEFLKINGIRQPYSIRQKVELNKTNEERSQTKGQSLIKHQPLYTSKFLKQFKAADGSGFKELVHDVILSEEKIAEIQNKLDNHPNFIYRIKKEYNIEPITHLNKGVHTKVKELIDLFRNIAIIHFRNAGNHPYHNNKEYTKFTEKFKKMYRYGSGTEYSSLLEEIKGIATSLKLELGRLEFLPDERKFQLRSSFFVWIPSFRSGLQYIFQGIRDHSNAHENGCSTLLDSKISVSVERVMQIENPYIQIEINDKGSVCKIESDKLLLDLKQSFAYTQDFLNVCDWSVECDFADESSKQLCLLASNNSNNTEINELSGSVGGFKHILKIYEPR